MATPIATTRTTIFARNLHSKSDYSQVLSGWKNARYDQLVEEAKRTLDPARRKELYTEAWNIVNVELPFFYLHEITQTSAAVKELRGYQPGSAGAVTLPRRRPAHRLYRDVIALPALLMGEGSGRGEESV